ncbi:MAG TPA: hypothetical protein VG936_00225 [Lacunisphaera sp.]|nr:hypothetical protein [Lacunisphaera sp.]
MAASTYSVTLHHLSPDATAAGLAFPDEQLQGVAANQLRDLLQALAVVASRLTIYEPSTPEIRVKTEREIFVIRTRYRRLCFVGWETILRGEDHSVAFIMATITGTLEAAKVTPKVIERYVPTPSTPSAAAMPGGTPRWFKIAVLATLIIGFNGFTAWMLLRPPPSVVPKHELVSESESRALLQRLSGEFETGAVEGQRHLVIMPSGELRLAKYGPQRSLREERTKTARGAILNGRTVLVLPDGVLEVKDNDTVVLYGSTYRRRGS